MRLTAEQRRAIEDDGDVCLWSCPGSGKTRTIVAKLVRCLAQVRGTTRRILCITHTNSAADEIYSRVRDLCSFDDGAYFEVSTIHSFALRAILTPYAHLLPEFRNGFQLIAPDADVFGHRVEELIQRHGLNASSSGDFEQIQRGPGGGFTRLENIPDHVQREWCAWFDARALTTLGDIVFHAGRLLREAHIASALASRFVWVLVDEFQDSSPGQTDLVRAIHRLDRTRLFCVGDPFQAIYGFTGATPDAMEAFAQEVAAAVHHRLTGNFRSSARVCARADRLRVGEVPMVAVGENRDWHAEPSHVRVADQATGIFDHFLPEATRLGVAHGQIAILAPSWMTLVPVARELRRRGIPAIGPGARPYRRAHLITRLLEPIGAYLESLDPEIAVAVQRGLFFVILMLTDHGQYMAFNFSSRIAVCRMLADARDARQRHALAVDWIADVAARITRILEEAALIGGPGAAALRASAVQLNEDILSRDGGDRVTVGDLGIFGRPNHCVQLLTVHQAKGREFEAIAVIEAHDDKFPNYRVERIPDHAEREAAYAESRRVFYVATTRAKRVLMFVTDTHFRRGRYQNRPSPFLQEMGL